MPKFRKKPVVINAIQWTGSNFDEVSQFTKNNHGNKFNHENSEELAIKSGDYFINSGMIVTKNDWVIEELDGSFSSCKNESFQENFEPIAEGYNNDQYVLDIRGVCAKIGEIDSFKNIKPE